VVHLQQNSANTFVDCIIFRQDFQHKNSFYLLYVKKL